VFRYYIVIAPNYILSQIELEAKGYGIKNSIANFMNKLSYTSDATNVLKYSSQGKVLLILVSKKNLSPPLRASNTIRIVKNGLEMRKLWSPKVKGVRNSKKTIEHYKGRFLDTQKVPFMLVFLLLKYQYDL
jgi:hypothetical protein